jgi:hypothetical protein
MMTYRSVCTNGKLTVCQRRPIGAQTLLWRWSAFFNKRCLAGFPWFWPARLTDKHVMVDARRLVRRHFGREHHPLYRALAQVLATLAWPPAVFVHLWQMRQVDGPEAVPVKRSPGAFWAAMRHNILPGEYYAYALWQPDRRENIDHYLYSNEAPRLFKLLNRPSQLDPIGDKLAFHEMCKTHALPTPAVLAAFTPTGMLLRFESDRPPERDLFVKPRFGLAGEGAERFRWHEAAFESDRGRCMRPQDLNGYLATRARSEKRTLLVQPVLSNHNSLRVETNAALATARLVTGRSTDGDVIPIFGFIYFARANRITAQHGYVALIDVASGRLMTAPQDISGTKPSNHRFESGSEDTYTLPDWPAVLRHTKVAHQACSNFVFVGWDTAFTDQGPMLLEGNANWSADEFQSLSGKPLGHTKFTDVLEAQLRLDGRSL